MNKNEATKRSMRKEIRNGFYRNLSLRGQGNKAKSLSWFVSQQEELSLHTKKEGFLQSRIKGGAESYQKIQTATSRLDMSSSVFNNERDKRPLPPALKASEKKDCPVCAGERNAHWTWRMPGGTVLYAYAPAQPNLPSQINVPLSLSHKTNIRELLPEEIICPLLFGRQIISEQISKVEKAYPGAYMHIGAVGSSIVHPLLALGAIWTEARYGSSFRFELGELCWQQAVSPRDVIWEENDSIQNGELQHLYIKKVGGETNVNRGWMIHSPFSPLAPYHIRVGALQEGIFNLGRMEDDQVVQLGFSLWTAIRLLGELKDAKGNQAINNLAINFEMLPTEKSVDNPKARMYVDIIPQETRRAGMELQGIPVVTDGKLVARNLRSLVGELREPTINTLADFFAYMKNHVALKNSSEFSMKGVITHEKTIDLLGERELLLDTRFDEKNNAHWVVRTVGDVEERTRYRWRAPWHGLYTTLIIPGGWSRGFSHVDYPSDFLPDNQACFADDATNLGFPHYQINIKEKTPITLVTNAFGFSGGNETAAPDFGPEVELILGGEIERIKANPSHLLAFMPEHKVNLSQIELADVKALFRTWRESALNIFGKSPLNNRLFCFANLGVEGGASIPHFHTQMLEVAEGSMGDIEKQIMIVDAAGRLIVDTENNPFNRAVGLALLADTGASRDLMAKLMKTEENEGRILFEDNWVISHVEGAPKFPFETVIRAKRPGASCLNYLMPEEIRSFSHAADLLREIYLKLKVEDMNVADEAAQYNNRESCWRYAIRFMPRRIGGKVKRIGALDLKGIHLVPVSPEMATKELLKVGGLL